MGNVGDGSPILGYGGTRDNEARNVLHNTSLIPALYVDEGIGKNPVYSARSTSIA